MRKKVCERQKYPALTEMAPRLEHQQQISAAAPWSHAPLLHRPRPHGCWGCLLGVRHQLLHAVWVGWEAVSLECVSVRLCVCECVCANMCLWNRVEERERERERTKCSKKKTRYNHTSFSSSFTSVQTKSSVSVHSDSGCQGPDWMTELTPSVPSPRWTLSVHIQRPSCTREWGGWGDVVKEQVKVVKPKQDQC